MKKNTTKLDELYSLREDFNLIGITGRTGSGCSDIAEVLGKEFKDLKNLVKPGRQPKSIQERKYEIVYNFNKLNWKKYRTIKYRNVLLLILSKNVNYKQFKNHLINYFITSPKKGPDLSLIEKVNKELYQEFLNSHKLLSKINSFGNISQMKDQNQLEELASLFWGEFDQFANRIDKILLQENNCIIERTVLLHHTALNFRKSGQTYKTANEDYDYIYFIAQTINRIIKGTKILEKGKCHITIDSLRNSLEINFFRERYSAFYLVAVKSDERKRRLLARYGLDKEDLVNKMLEIDTVEYRVNDFVEGHFFSPDVQNCIQKADFHIITREMGAEFSEKRDFYSIEQQILKLQGLIQQPGLIAPSTVERCMQFAYNAKLNSGCISRQVGAVITDSEFSVKSIGWNDVPSGVVPCVNRNVKDISKKVAFGFSDFELGNGYIEKSVKVGKGKASNPDNVEIDQESKDYNKFVKDNYNRKNLKEKDLGGINCPYCFKTAYNKFKGENNQVHTRSLHAEENAMMQISKYGGQPLRNGYLFTTASPCELCSKKAYQLGIKDIYYIDPYPGISRSNILRNSLESDPNLYMFYGAIGRGFFKLYEPFMSLKDEVSILTNFKLHPPFDIKAKQLKKLLEEKFSTNAELKNKFNRLFEDENKVFEKVVGYIEEGLKSD